MLAEVCGPAFPIPDTTCCTSDQINTLRSSLAQAEPLLASCPACRNNFRAYHCSFTCSPDQSLFLDVVSTQKTDTAEAVKEVNYYVSSDTAQAFYESCADVQFGATNGFAMDLIGGGAKNASSFLKYMGEYRPGLGSPFQISIPPPMEAPSDMKPLSYKPLNCADPGLESRCTCIDCPSVCAVLPPVAPPSHKGCTIGAVSCLTFTALILYSLAILFALVAYSWKLSVKHRARRYERLVVLSPSEEPNTNPFNHHTMTATDASADAPPTSVRPTASPDASSHPSHHSSRFRLGRGASLLDPLDALQPRRSGVNTWLRRGFYRLGMRCATDRGTFPL
jgi:Niemann-Pick C1 protein